MLRDHWEIENREDSKQALMAWNQEAKNANWESPQDIKDQFGNASFVGKNRVVFNIAGNKYRLVVHISYDYGVVYTRFVGTHAEYDKIDVGTI